MKFPQSVNVLLLGSGGREHAFAWKIAQSPKLSVLYIAPGNAGTAAIGKNVDLQPSNFGSIKQFVLNNNINLVVVGSEEPLVKGIVDFFNEDSDIHHVSVIGPSMAGARLEGSKDFAKSFMKKHEIPTAASRSFTKDLLEKGYEFLDSLKPPYVLKADGLAAGKGVLIIESIDQAKVELKNMLDGKFGVAGNTVVIEEFLSGIECSVFVATDGKDYKILPVAKDYKRIGEGDTGLNTGGMGAVSPVPFADADFMQKVEERIIKPTIDGLGKDKIIYKGFVFIGLMNCAGDPFVIEYNVRMGDPETEVVLPLIESDIMELFEGMAYGTLADYDLKLSEQHAATVVCVAGGYPDDYNKGDTIQGLDNITGSIAFHGGTAEKAGKILTNGGRVLAVTSLGETLQAALATSYESISKIGFDGMYYRKDIGKDLL